MPRLRCRSSSGARLNEPVVSVRARAFSAACGIASPSFYKLRIQTDIGQKNQKVESESQKKKKRPLFAHLLRRRRGNVKIGDIADRSCRVQWLCPYGCGTCGAPAC